MASCFLAGDPTRCFAREANDLHRHPGEDASTRRTAFASAEGPAPRPSGSPRLNFAAGLILHMPAWSRPAAGSQPRTRSAQHGASAAQGVPSPHRLVPDRRICQRASAVRNGFFPGYTVVNSSAYTATRALSGTTSQCRDLSEPPQWPQLDHAIAQEQTCYRLSAAQLS